MAIGFIFQNWYQNQKSLKLEKRLNLNTIVQFEIRIVRHDIESSVTYILIVDFLCITAAYRQMLPSFSKQLIGLFNRTDYGYLRIIWHFINIENILHTNVKLGIMLLWYIPICDCREFFEVLRIVSLLTGFSKLFYLLLPAIPIFSSHDLPVAHLLQA